MMFCFFFFKQKTAYEMRISDWSSDVCSSDLRRVLIDALGILAGLAVLLLAVFLEALLEGVDALSHVAHQLRNLAAAAEQDQDHRQHDEPVPDTTASHSGISLNLISCAALDRKSTRLNSSH